MANAIIVGFRSVKTRAMENALNPLSGLEMPEVLDSSVAMLAKSSSDSVTVVGATGQQ